jgi:hypothetical protein
VGTIINAKDDDIPYSYWNLSGAMYAYLFIELTKLGIDVVGESQLVGYPSQFPDVSMMNWNNGKPNSRYWILKLLKDNFSPGDKLAVTVVNGADIISQGLITKTGKKILLINPHNKEVKINLPSDLKDAMVFYVDMNTREEPIAQMQLKANTITLQPFAVMVVNMK